MGFSKIFKYPLLSLEIVLYIFIYVITPPKKKKDCFFYEVASKESF